MNNFTKILLLITLSVLMLFSIYREIKIKNLKAQIHQKNELLIKKDLEIELQKLMNSNQQLFINGYKSQKFLDSVYQARLNSYEPLE